MCGFGSRCTRNRRGRIIFRSEFEEAVERLRSRLETSEGKEKLNLRRVGGASVWNHETSF